MSENNKWKGRVKYWMKFQINGGQVYLSQTLGALN